MDNLERKRLARVKFRSIVSDSFTPFDCYGLGIFISPAIKNILSASEELIKEMNGANGEMEVE